MDNDIANNGAEALARRMLNRIWHDLPEERRTSDELRSEALQLMSRAAAKFQPRQNPYARVRETYPNAGKPWKRTDDEELRRLFAAGNSVDDLMLLFGRTRNGVQQRLLILGLVPQPAAVA
jgi:hypothetical protein